MKQIHSMKLILDICYVGSDINTGVGGWGWLTEKNKHQNRLSNRVFNFFRTMCKYFGRLSSVLGHSDTGTDPASYAENM